MMIRFWAIAVAAVLVSGCAGRPITVSLAIAQNDRADQIQRLETVVRSAAPELNNFTITGERFHRARSNGLSSDADFGVGLFRRPDSPLFLEFGFHMNSSEQGSWLGGPSIDCSFTCVPSEYSIDTDLEEHTFPLALRGDLRIGRDIVLYGRIGAALTSFEVTNKVCVRNCIEHGGDGAKHHWQQHYALGWLGGVGAQWKLLSVQYGVQQVPAASGWRFGHGALGSPVDGLHVEFKDRTLMHTLRIGLMVRFGEER